MADLLVNELRVLRDTCAKVSLDHGLSGAGGIEDVITKLNLMIVERTCGAAFDENRRSEVARSGYLGFDTNSAASPTLHSGSARALRSDYDYWRNIDLACHEEAGAAANSNPEALSRETGEEDRAAQLTAFLQAELPDEPKVEVVDMRVMTAGYSKKTYHAKLSGNKAIPEHVVIRADQNGYVKTTVLNEFSLLKTLEKHGVPVPHAYIIEKTGKYFGTPFIVMDFVEGKTVGDPFNAPPFNAELVRSTASAMAFYHAIPLESLQIAGISYDPQKPHVESEVRQYLETWRSIGHYCPTIDVAFEWINDHMTYALGRNVLVHNDFNYNNMLVKDNRVTSILDWEFAHIGNPAADIGYYRYAADCMGAFDLFKRAYSEAGGTLPTDNEIDFYYVWGMTRLGVMILQAQGQFDEGRNSDLRFAVAAAKYLRPTLMAIGKFLDGVLEK